MKKYMKAIFLTNIICFITSIEAVGTTDFERKIIFKRSKSESDIKDYDNPKFHQLNKDKETLVLKLKTTEADRKACINICKKDGDQLEKDFYENEKLKSELIQVQSTNTQLLEKLAELKGKSELSVHKEWEYSASFPMKCERLPQKFARLFLEDPEKSVSWTSECERLPRKSARLFPEDPEKNVSWTRECEKLSQIFARLFPEDCEESVSWTRECEKLSQTFARLFPEDGKKVQVSK